MTTPHTKTIDEYSFAARPTAFCYANQCLAMGTVFFWYEADQTYLITNWHNVAGINPATGQCMRTDANRPTRFETSLFLADGTANFRIQSYKLYDTHGQPLWRVHAEHGSRVDVVALPIEIPRDCTAHPINRLPVINDLKLRVGHDLFILGFPFSQTIFDWAGLPIWKRGSLATEPSMVQASQLYMLVDTASRQGMSGAPVIRRAHSGAERENGSMSLSGGSRFVGVYAGRLTTLDPNDAQLGRVYERQLVEEIVKHGVRDTTVEIPIEPDQPEELVSLQRIGPRGQISL